MSQLTPAVALTLMTEDNTVNLNVKSGIRLFLPKACSYVCVRGLVSYLSGTHVNNADKAILSQSFLYHRYKLSLFLQLSVESVVAMRLTQGLKELEPYCHPFLALVITDELYPERLEEIRTILLEQISTVNQGCNLSFTNKKEDHLRSYYQNLLNLYNLVGNYPRFSYEKLNVNTVKRG